MVGGCALGAIWLYRVSHVANAKKKDADIHAEMKLVAAAIYSNYACVIIDDDGIEETDAYTVRPRGEKLVLKFKAL